MALHQPVVGGLLHAALIAQSFEISEHNPETLETNVRGIYLAGSIVSGKMTNRIFIETGRFHGEQIFKHFSSNGDPVSASA